MHTSTATLLFLYGIGALAAPSVNTQAKALNTNLGSSGSFSVAAQPNPKFIRNGRRAYRKALLKHNLPMPAGLVKRDGSVEAKPSSQDDEYVCEVQIGSNRQKLNLDFDTGSSDLWVFSSELPKNQTDGRKFFDPSKSKSFKRMAGSTWNITYGDGSGASGDVGTDFVWVGGVYFKQQAVELANHVSDMFTQDTFSDGLLGLAWDNINTVEPKPVKTFSSNVIPYLDDPLFTADLRHNETGAYDFGHIDRSKYSGKLKYVPVMTEGGFWEFPAAKYKVGNKVYDDVNGTTAIADTGTTLILVSNTIADAYYKGVKGATYDKVNEGYTFPCNAKLPTMSLSVGKYIVDIEGEYLNYGPVDAEHQTTCYGGMQGYDTSTLSGTPQYIYGDIFLKKYFAVFDMGNKRFGFAPKADSDSGSGRNNGGWWNW